MFRIRRRTALLLCSFCSIAFFTVYVVINYAAPSVVDRKATDTVTIAANKFQKLDKFRKDSQNQIENSVLQWKQSQQFHNLRKPPTAAFQKVDENVRGICTVDLLQAPQPNIQMLDFYNNISFADIDGGAWKQGWNIKYDPMQFNDHHKLRVFVVPHSHNDPGWIKTFDDYYEHDTKHILSNALRHLRENPDMKFIWAEISYFYRFYEELGANNRNEIKKLVQNGQLEFVTGGWVMPDEANSHWFSVLLQLTEGHEWLKSHLNVTPISSWSIDPFGHSPTLPYILKKSGFQNLLIQRTHYSVKKELALKRQLEFNWRQLWDNSGETDLLTHMMPFYSYDIPHTCGPDPKICCQFDFKRMKGFGLSCPWHVPPQAIEDFNVDHRSEMLVDQWKKKAELYRTNSVLIPLGDDFRYSQSTEWEVQRVNYEALFNYINSERKFFVEAKFATLQEYFDAVRHEQPNLPTLSGDFFTYADRTDNYWSGYYTSRPYHKRMERVLLHYVRSAEMLHAWTPWDPAAKFEKMLQNARRELSLFQHHDGITGTAKTHVVMDYAQRMLNAVKDSRFVMQQAVYRLLTKPSIYNADYKFNYFYLDDSRWPGPDDARTTIILGEELPSKHVVFHNSLPQWREELVDFFVSTPYVSVSDFDDTFVEAQVSPVWTWHRHSLSNTITPQASTTKYRLLFKVKVPPLGLVTYIIHMESLDAKLKHTAFAANLILATSPISANLGDYPIDVKFGEPRDLTLKVGDGPTVAFSDEGLLKSIQIDESYAHLPVDLRFLKYNSRTKGDRSGAYLFLPSGPAVAITGNRSPILIIEGPLEASVAVGLPFAVHQTVLRGSAPEIRNLVDITSMDDTEVVMRISTHIQNGDIFYTDLNGLQMIKRRRLSKLPLQANYYPVPTAIYIEDDTFRLTVVSAQPLGGTSLAQGEVEIMQDRRLTHDDERGLGQGVLDNQPVLHIFRVILEKISGCTKPSDMHPSGALTEAAHRDSKSILNPIDKFIFIENHWLGVQAHFGADHVPLNADLEVVAMRNLGVVSNIVVARDRVRHVKLKTGIIVHRTLLLQCSDDESSSGAFVLKSMLQVDEGILNISSTTLTFIQHLEKLESHEEVALCPMDTKAFVIHHNS